MDRRSAFVADWSGEALAIGTNELGAGLTRFERFSVDGELEPARAAVEGADAEVEFDQQEPVLDRNVDERHLAERGSAARRRAFASCS